MFVLFLFSKLPRPWELRILKHNNPLLCCIYYTPPATVLWWRYSPRVTHLKHSRHASSQYIYWASVMVYLVSTLGKWLFITQAVLRFTRRINRKWGIKISGVHELSTSGTEKELPTAVGSHASCSPGNTHINDKKQWEGVYRGSVHGWWERPKWKETLVMNQWELGDEQEGGMLTEAMGRERGRRWREERWTEKPQGQPQKGSNDSRGDLLQGVGETCEIHKQIQFCVCTATLVPGLAT